MKFDQAMTTHKFESSQEKQLKQATTFFQGNEGKRGGGVGGSTLPPPELNEIKKIYKKINKNRASEQTTKQKRSLELTIS